MAGRGGCGSSSSGRHEGLFGPLGQQRKGGVLLDVHHLAHEGLTLNADVLLLNLRSRRGSRGDCKQECPGPKWCLERWEQSGRPLTSSPLYFILGSLNLGSSVLLVLCPTQPMASSIRKAFSGLKTAAWEVGQGGGGQGD